MQKIKVFLFLLSIILFYSCIETDTFVDIQESEHFQPLQNSKLLSDSDKNEITEFIQDNYYFDAVVALHGNNKFYDYGEIDIPFNSASVRKSIFSAVYGIAAHKGIIDLDATLAELEIDDEKNPLTDIEKSATLRHLLQARSGIYIPAAGESDGMKEKRPNRGEYAPGEHFYYNNWDFNVLPIILEKKTGKSIGKLIYEWIAIPIGMKNFLPDNVTYQYVDYTEYPQTRVYISAEDLARLGALYLNDGKWNDEQIIPSDWIDISTQAVSLQPEDKDLLENEMMEGYAYLWWVDTDENNFWADGSGGQFLVVDKQNNLAMVFRNNTGMSTNSYLLYGATERYQTNQDGNKIYKFIRSKI